MGTLLPFLRHKYDDNIMCTTISLILNSLGLDKYGFYSTLDAMMKIIINFNFNTIMSYNNGHWSIPQLNIIAPLLLPEQKLGTDRKGESEGVRTRSSVAVPANECQCESV